MLSKKKQCTGCKKILTLNNFHKNHHKKDGLHGRCKECRKNNPETIRLYRIKNFEKRKIQLRKWRKENRERSNEWTRLYNKKPEVKKKRNLYLKNRINTDPCFKILHSLRNRLRIALKLSGSSKNESVKNLVGISIEGLKKYLESKFKTGMTWKNYNKFGWHIDHIIPCASFDLSKPKEQIKCFHYTNLQPLWWYENLAKGAKMPNKYEKQQTQVDSR
jgi:hypothetical protein